MVSFATRPLHIEELKEAVVFDLQDSVWDAGKIPQTDFIIGCCANLVTADPTDNCVRFAHSSVKQYLEKEKQTFIPGYPISAEEGDLECGELCVTYLSFSNFGLQLEGRTVVINTPEPIYLAGESLASPFGKLFSRMGKKKCSTSRLFPKIRSVSAPDRSQYRFLDYATTNWAPQTKRITRTSTVWEKFEQLALCFNESWNFHPWVPGGRSPRSHLHGLFGWAVKEQHEPLLSIALNSK